MTLGKEVCKIALNGDVTGTCRFYVEEVERCTEAASSKKLFKCKTVNVVGLSASCITCDKKLFDIKFKDHCSSLDSKATAGHVHRQVLQMILIMEI